MQKCVITIARGFGSGGKEIGVKLAERLGIPCYEQQILRMASESSGINEALFNLADEKIAENVVVTERAVEKRTLEKCMKIVTAKFLTLESLVWYVKYV